ncbi:MAG: hypothetical protein APF81_14690 [Desulfosporosinus sp. BRH_c37]|nr:MAG: hypothetical protein APF81_14690 [Desulfosporosinus sp. BRH_c37]
MKTLVKNFLLSVSSPERPKLSEAEYLKAEIEEARKKINYAWNRFDYAAPEYVELAVLELLLVETHYCLLNKRYRIMLGINKPFFSFDSHLQYHALYGTFFNTSSH